MSTTKTMSHKSRLLCGVVLGFVVCDAAAAQTALSKDVSIVEEVVVTGTGAGRTKLDAPFAISTFGEKAIERAAPLSSVDLLKTTPGFSAEASGGQGGGQNIYARGLPAGGWFYVQLQEDGLTLFDEPQESFLNIDTFFALDMMTQRVEVVRGGTSPIFANNAPGGTVNVITRRGTPTPEGAVRATAGNRGLWRVDGYQAGPLSDKILYSAGGFYRRDDGFRETGYTADKGGQIRGNLSFLLEKGRVDVDVKYLNDRTAFYNPIPLADPRNPGVSLSNLIDPLKGTLQSDKIQHVLLRTFDGAQNQTKARDLANGIHNQIFETGVSAAYDLGDGWKLSNKLRYTDATVSYDAIFSGAAPADAAAYLATQLSRAQAGFGASVTRVGYVRNGVAFDPATSGGLVMESGWWTANTDVRTIANDLRLTKVFEESPLGRHDLSFGLYFNTFDFQQTRLQSTILTPVINRPDALNVVAYNAAGGVVGSVTENGFVRYGNGVVKGESEGSYLSPYIADTWRLTDKFAIDAGLRYTVFDEKGRSYGTTVRNLGDATTLADDNVGGLSGASTTKSERLDATSWTVGSEYKIDPRIQLFARYTSSKRFPRLQNVYQLQSNPVTGIKQAEGGIRTAFPGLSFSVIGFTSAFDRLTLSALVLNPQTGTIQNLPLIGQTRTKGVESELDWRPTDLFGLRGSLTWQDPKTKSLTNQATGATGYNGNQLSRIPKLMASATPTLYLKAAGRPVEISATVIHQGKRFVDYANTTALPAYTTVDLNLIADITDRLSFQAHVSNLTEEVGLTEGNARTDVLSGQGTAEAIYARPLFGRLYTAALTYRW